LAGPWFLAADLKQDVADALKESSVANLEPYWDSQCQKAVDAAYRDLSGILLGKGYTIDQLDSWDFRVSYSNDQALFWLMTRTSLGMGYDDKEINKLDHRKELLESATIMIAGAPVAPGSASAGGVGGGSISEDGYRINGSTTF
jgi:hypothetical protein